MAYYKDFGFKVQEFTYRKIYKLSTEDPSKKKKEEDITKYFRMNPAHLSA